MFHNLYNTRITCAPPLLDASTNGGAFHCPQPTCIDMIGASGLVEMEKHKEAGAKRNCAAN
ncbi:hypothetical protein CKF48_13905 [Cytobacillus kochii]|uniref:Uncharacterized protein n=1 Tax=Cytobacillus kochii TaxID=859143 RepID=A0A248TJD4_9BACI|nr:hypothetical protein CKF48_13905 [Cytobacillus kochii]